MIPCADEQAFPAGDAGNQDYEVGIIAALLHLMNIPPISTTSYYAIVCPIGDPTVSNMTPPPSAIHMKVLLDTVTCLEFVESGL
jgi:hypothetical protein